jgi:alpha-beta hydrolase superfamily lysophospholipase
MTNNLNIERTPLYFGEQQGSLFGWYHAPKTQQPHLAMVICPPIGLEYVHSHRSLRHLADNLAHAGIACFRFDYHGTGDSAGVDEDSSRVSSWLESINQAIFQMKALSLCHEVGLIGFRIGATLATVIAETTDLSCMVLWAPCIRGRNYIREMKALRASGSQAQHGNVLTDNTIESGGFVLTEQTIDDLSKIDLRNVIPRTKKVLVVMRDDLSETSQRLDQWIEYDIHPAYLKFSGYSDIVSPPDATKIPFDTISKIAGWIIGTVIPYSVEKKDDFNVTPAPHRPVPISKSISVETTRYEKECFDLKLTKIRESILQFGSEKQLFGILSQPLSKDWQNRPTIVLSNSGAVHHIGPNRLYVLLARNISRSGFRCLRMDLSGLGDSYIEDITKENDSYVSSSSTDINEALKSLQHDETKFIIMGLCSGAHASFHAAMDLISQPIEECILINPITFYWKEGMSLSTTLSLDTKWVYYKNTMRKKERWIKLIRGDVDLKSIINTVGEKVITIIKNKFSAILRHFRLIDPIPDDLNSDLKSICSAGRKISFIFSTTDPGYDVLKSNAKSAVNKLSKKQCINIQFVKDADHTFTTNTHRIELTNKLINHLVKRYL